MKSPIKFFVVLISLALAAALTYFYSLREASGWRRFGDSSPVLTPQAEALVSTPASASASAIHRAMPAHAAGKEENTLERLDRFIMNTLASTTLSDEAKFALVWAEYQKNRYHPVLDGYFLDSLLGISPLPHVGLLINELRDATTTYQAKKHLIRLLETAYLDRNDNATLAGVSQQSILAAIHANTYSPDLSLAGLASLTYARLAPIEAADQVLTEAYRRKTISEQEFVHTSSFNLTSLPGAQINPSLLNLIRIAEANKTDESNKTLVQNLAQLIQTPDSFARFDAASRKTLSAFFAKHEPAMDSDHSGYDMSGAVRYAAWLGSCALLKQSTAGNSTGYLLTTLSHPQTSTQKMLAILLAPEGPDVIRMARETGQVGVLRDRIASDVPGLLPDSNVHSVYQAALMMLQ